MYQMKAIKRLMAAVLLRAIRDVYAEDKVVRYQAKEWLESKSVEHVNLYRLKVPQFKLQRWIESDFTDCVVQLDVLGNPVMAKMTKKTGDGRPGTDEDRGVRD